MLLSTLLLALPFVAAAPSPWQANDSPAHALFKRQAQQGAGAGTGAAPAAPGSSGSPYPAELAVPKQSPKEWTDKLKSVQIADVPVAEKDPASDNAVIYPGNPSVDELSDPKGKYCAYSTGCMREGDIRDLPEGVFGVSFTLGTGICKQGTAEAAARARMADRRPRAALRKHITVPKADVRTAHL